MVGTVAVAGKDVYYKTGNGGGGQETEWDQKPVYPNTPRIRFGKSGKNTLRVTSELTERVCM